MQHRTARQRPTVLLIVGVAFLFCSATAVTAAESQAAKSFKAPRTPDGQPDLQGTWTNASLTTLLRPAALGNKLVLTETEAAAMERQAADRVEAGDRPSDLTRELPRGGGVGGYNSFWIDSGTRVMTVNGERRTSIIVEPANGQLPPFTPQAQKAQAARQQLVAQSGFDGPEVRALGERCMLSFGTHSGPPMLPVLYNNHYQIVQSPGHVMILAEMVHDARVVRLSGQHPPPHIRKWLGDSIGRWEGATLVVETTNFHPQQPLQIGAGASYRMVYTSDKLKVTERFTRAGPDTITYQFTVDDPDTFTQPWRGELSFHRTDSLIYEYACHEGNYALPGILAGAREQEKTVKAQ
jgi:hypothetical protein